MEEILNLLKKEYTLQKSIDSVKNIIEPVFFKLTLDSIIKKFDNTSKEYRTDWSKLLFDVKKSKGVLSTLIKGLYGTYGGNLEYIVNLNTDEYAPKDVTMVFANTPNKKEQKELVKVFQESLGPQYNVILINSDITSNRKVQKEAKEAIFIAKREGKKVVFISRDMGSRSFSVPEIDTVILMFDRGSYATVTQKISRVLTPGKTYHNQEKKYGYIISLSLDPNRDEVSPIDEYIVYESEKVNVNELSDGIKRVLRSINIFTNDSGELTTLELDQYSEKLISSSTLIKIGKASSNPDSILLDTNLVDFLTGIKIDGTLKQKIEKLEGIDSADVGRFLEENTSSQKDIKKDDEVKKIISVREKIRQHIENIFDNICEISEINNCESNNIFECLEMIKNKGYESEVIFEVGIDCEKVKKIIELGGISEKLLNTIITSYNKNPELNKWKQNQNNGEVFTPSRLVRRMLDRIPEKVWKNPKSTFCDLSMGTGSFLVEIVNRLVNIYNYTEEDAKSRVFGYDIHVKYVNYLKRMGYKNLFCTDSLKENFKMRFDVVLGNPPYQELDNNGKPKGGGKGGGNNLWSKFFMKSIEISNTVFLIHPPSFLSPNHVVFNKMYENGGLKYLKIFEKSPFDNVGTQACYYHWERDYKGLCEIGDKMIDLRDKILPNSYNPIDFSIFSKFFNQNEVFNFIRNCEIHTQNKKEYITTELTITNQNKLYVGSKIKYTSLFIDDMSTNKVIVSRSGYLNPIFDNDSCVSESNYYVKVENETIGNNLVKILKSKLYSYCLNKSKFSGFFHGEVLKNIPKIDLNKEWKDSDLYKYFNLTEEEIKHIEDNVK